VILGQLKMCSIGNEERKRGSSPKISRGWRKSRRLIGLAGNYYPRGLIRDALLRKGSSEAKVSGKGLSREMSTRHFCAADIFVLEGKLEIFNGNSFILVARRASAHFLDGSKTKVWVLYGIAQGAVGKWGERKWQFETGRFEKQRSAVAHIEFIRKNTATESGKEQVKPLQTLRRKVATNRGGVLLLTGGSLRASWEKSQTGKREVSSLKHATVRDYEEGSE